LAGRHLRRRTSERYIGGEVARAVTQPEDRLEHEIELRFTSDLRRLDYAALFDQSGKLQYGNVVAIPEGLPIDGKSHTVEMRKLRGDDAGTEPVVFVAGQRQDGGIVLLGGVFMKSMR